MPSNDERLRLQIVIVNYNVAHYAAQTIRSVLRAVQGISYELWLVDNASSDGSLAYLQGLFPQVRYIGNTDNVGFSRANNMAIRQCDSQYVLLLNPDTIVAEDALQQCLYFMDSHPDTGSVGAMHQDAMGRFARESRRALPTPMVSFWKMVGCQRRYYMSHLPLDRPGLVEVQSGAFMFLRRDALEQVGLLDERFFMYGEDIDLSYRLTLGGWHNYYLPVHVMHYKGESTHKSSFRYVHVFYDAMLIFYNKHFASRYFMLTHLIRLAVVGRGAVDYIMKKMRCLRARLFPYRREDEVFLVQVPASMQADVERLLSAHSLPYHTEPQPGTEYTYLLLDDARPYTDLLHQSRLHPGLLLAIYSPDHHHILTHCNRYV